MSISYRLLLPILLLATPAIGCTDTPTIQLPLSTQFPVEEVQLGMTFGDLRRARPEVMVVPDSATVVEELFRGRFHYAFASQRRNRGPSRGSRLVYIDRVHEEVAGDYARRRWDSLVVALAGELGVEPSCSSIEYGRLRWRRATFREEGQPVAAAVDVVGVGARFRLSNGPRRTTASTGSSSERPEPWGVATTMEEP